MKKIVIVIGLLLVVGIILNKAGVLPTGQKELKEGSTAPTFTVKQSNGLTFRLSDAKGKVVVLNFWATWCGPCCRELPAFQRLYNQYGDKIQIIAIDIGESAEEVSSFVLKNGYKFPVGLDEDRSVSALYPTQSIPYTLIIDQEGKISKIFVGAASAEEQFNLYNSAIQKLL